MATIRGQGKTPTDDELRTYIQVLKKDPASTVFAALADGLLARQRVEQAFQVAQAGLRANPEFTDGHLVMARVLLARGQPDQAARFAQRVRELFPDKAPAHAVCAQILLELGKEQAASEACLEALDLDPECELALDLLGRFSPTPAVEASVPAPAAGQAGLKERSNTTPSNRQRNGRPAEQISDPFHKILPALGQDAAERLDSDEQPFTALSSGSQSGIGNEAGDLLEQAPRPSLPARPEPPLRASPEGPGPSNQAEAQSLRTVAVAQAIIDSYGPAEAYEPSGRIPKPSPPWSGRLLAIASVLALLVGIVAMLFAIMPDRTTAQADKNVSVPQGGGDEP